MKNIVLHVSCDITKRPLLLSGCRYGTWVSELSYSLSGTKKHTKTFVGSISSSRFLNKRNLILMGICDTMNFIRTPVNMTLVTDNIYVTASLNNGYMDIWSKNNWVTTKGKPVQNAELWKLLYPMVKQDCKFIRDSVNDNVKLNELVKRACKINILNMSNYITGKFLNS